MLLTSSAVRDITYTSALAVTKSIWIRYTRICSVCVREQNRKRGQKKERYIDKEGESAKEIERA